MMARPAWRFAYRLALALGQPNVRTMLSGLTGRELLEWEAFDRIEPFGEERADLRTGILASTLCNLRGRKGRRSQPQDFMPRFGGEPSRRRATTPAAMRAIMTALTAAHNAQAGRTDGDNR